MSAFWITEKWDKDRVALNNHGGDGRENAIMRQDHTALTHESPGRIEQWVGGG
jgi:hypothetical protein